MSDAITLLTRPGEIEIAVRVGGRLADHALWWPGAPDGFGDVLDGLVTARSALTGGSFVTAGSGPDGFLPDREIERPPSVGERVRVRVIRSAMGGKGPRFSARRARDAGGGNDPVGHGKTPLEEVAERWPGLPIVADGPEPAARWCSVLPDRAWSVERERDARLLDGLEALRSAVVALPSGAQASFTPTPALVAIDVDLGGAGEAGRGRLVGQFEANRALLPDLFDQVRWRNLAGAILVDFAGLPARKREALGPFIAEALCRDPASPKLLGFTRLGLAEIVRAPGRPSLHERLASPRAASRDAAEDLLRRMRERPGVGFGLAVAPLLHAAFADDADLSAGLDAAAGRPVRVRSDPALAPSGWNVEAIDER